ncbi:hypothetical protein F4809DRAFT_317434 [Biscogniauxia mediterranea]|nr:hypothetical protein F4809DRAFT_317434 [Biscogniauxia mediterranea]
MGFFGTSSLSSLIFCVSFFSLLCLSTFSVTKPACEARACPRVLLVQTGKRKTSNCFLSDPARSQSIQTYKYTHTHTHTHTHERENKICWLCWQSTPTIRPTMLGLGSTLHKGCCTFDLRDTYQALTSIT